jgi:hypothetical protein
MLGLGLPETSIGDERVRELVRYSCRDWEAERRACGKVAGCMATHGNPAL